MELIESKSRQWIYTAVKKGYKVTKEGDIISPLGKKRALSDNIRHKGGSAYKRFGIRDAEGKHANIDVHRFQGYAKFGDAIFGKGIHVRHLDGNSENNTWDNIAIGTQSDNFMDQPKEVRQARAEHAASFLKKYDNEKVYQFFMESNRSWKKTMEEFSISSKGTLSHILKAKHAEHGTGPSANRSHVRKDLVKK